MQPVTSNIHAKTSFVTAMFLSKNIQIESKVAILLENFNKLEKLIVNKDKISDNQIVKEQKQLRKDLRPLTAKNSEYLEKTQFLGISLNTKNQIIYNDFRTREDILNTFAIIVRNDCINEQDHSELLDSIADAVGLNTATTIRHNAGMEFIAKKREISINDIIVDGNVAEDIPDEILEEGLAIKVSNQDIASIMHTNLIKEKNKYLGQRLQSAILAGEIIEINIDKANLTWEDFENSYLKEEEPRLFTLCVALASYLEDRRLTMTENQVNYDESSKTFNYKDPTLSIKIKNPAIERISDLNLFKSLFSKISS